MEIRKRLCELEPGRSDLQRDLSVSFERLGDINRQLGRGDEALKFYEKAMEIRKRLCELEPEVIERQADMVVSYYKIGDFYCKAGDEDKGKGLFRKALDILLKLRSEGTLEYYPQYIKWIEVLEGLI